MTQAASIAGELRAGWPGSWVIKGIDRAQVFGEDLARRGVTTLAGARLVQAGTARTVGTVYDYAAQAFTEVDAPVFVVQFASGALGYGDGFKGYAETTLKQTTNAIARTTDGAGAVQLRAVDLGGGRAGFVPFWEDTSDKDDALAIVLGVGAVVTAGVLAGAASGLGAAEAIGGLEAAASAEAGIGTLSGTVGGSVTALAPETLVSGLSATAASVPEFVAASSLAGGGSLLAKAGAVLTTAATKAAGSAVTAELVKLLGGSGASGATGATAAAGPGIDQSMQGGQMLALLALVAAAAFALA